MLGERGAGGTLEAVARSNSFRSFRFFELPIGP